MDGMQWVREQELDTLAHLEDEQRSKTGVFEMEQVNPKVIIHTHHELSSEATNFIEGIAWAKFNEKYEQATMFEEALAQLGFVIAMKSTDFTLQQVEVYISKSSQEG